MVWNKDNIENIVRFINSELRTGRAMNRIEIEEFAANERVIHKRLLRLGYKKIDNQYQRITVLNNSENTLDDNSIKNAYFDVVKLNLLLDNIDKLLKLIPNDITSNITIKSGNNEVRSLRIDTGIYEAIKQRSSRDRINISAIVNMALEDYLNKYL